MKLNIGSGSVSYPGYHNLDVTPGENIHYVYDLDSAPNNKIPVHESSVSKILMSHVLEHLSKPLEALSELHRIAQNGCKLRVRVPHSNNIDAWIDPTHKRPWHWRSFSYFTQPKYYNFDYGYSGDWFIEAVKISVRKEYIGRIQNIEELDLISNIGIELIVDMVAIKPIRPKKKELIQYPKIEIVAHPYDPDNAYWR